MIIIINHSISMNMSATITSDYHYVNVIVYALWSTVGVYYSTSSSMSLPTLTVTL